MARTVEDVLARRCRSLLLDCSAAVKVAPLVAQVMAEELHRDAAWCEEQKMEFESVAANYMPQQGVL